MPPKVIKKKNVTSESTVVPEEITNKVDVPEQSITTIPDIENVVKPETEAKTNILRPVVTRFRRDLWIADEPVKEVISAMRNSVNSGVSVENLPPIYIYPIVLEQDSSNQTGEKQYKNLLAINEYGILTKEQMTSTFSFLQDYPRWEQCFVPLRSITKVEDSALEKEVNTYPIFVPCSNYVLLEHFAFLVRTEIFNKSCK